ncbi:MAG: cysteinyl-tRNA synthetase [Thermomicrobium sp.]|nr:cysteinyl-tRNA synthetase [Thermomicrobium sp.]MDW8058724.1 cysteinyl-tRNA synthetase [Thermomicrobium sp.]
MVAEASNALQHTGSPGPVALIGSGETGRAGRQAFAALLTGLEPPVRIAILETPAGFQPNAALVARRIGDFLREHLPEFRPEIRFVPARQRGTVFDPDAPLVLDPIDWADCLFAGPGSPTYMIRQLTGSHAWTRIVERWLGGMRLAFASAAAVAVGRYALPVYEIYKVGADLHWVDGLDLFGVLGLALAIVPHWNNREGGAELDTSRCFMGRERFARLLRLLPAPATILGIDEHTSCLIDSAASLVQVLGAGTVTVLAGAHERTFRHGERFPLGFLGSVPTAEHG